MVGFAAILVAVYGPVLDPAVFRHGWVFMILTAAGTLVAGVAIQLRVKTRCG